MGDPMENNVVPLKSAKNSDVVLDVASDWLAKFDRGLSEQEELQLKQWLSESTAHQDMFLKMARLWDNLGALERLKVLFPEPPVKPATYRPWAIAASFVLTGMLIAVGLRLTPDWIIGSDELVVLSEQYFETGIGDLKRVTLSDGSQLFVNTNSSVKVTFTQSQRVIELNKGELHIQVAHNTQRPLSVFAAGQVIQAVGTAFNVELSPGSASAELVELIVTEGKVRIAKQAATLVTPESTEQVRLPEHTTALVEGQKALLSDAPIDDTTKLIRDIAASEINAQLSWHSGNLVFRGESLQHVLNEVSRYNAVSFEVADNILNETRVAGLFKTNDLSGFLKALEQNFAINNVRLADNRILLKQTG